jgi:hypothetical protein
VTLGIYRRLAYRRLEYDETEKAESQQHCLSDDFIRSLKFGLSPRKVLNFVGHSLLTTTPFRSACRRPYIRHWLKRNELVVNTNIVL